MRCPACRNELNEEKSPEGIFYSCHKCGGRSVSLYLLQKLGMPQEQYALLNDAAKAKPEPFARECPNCRKKMTKCKLPIGEGLVLDVCGVCRQIWFDPSEFQALRFEQHKQPSPKELPPECKEALAMAMVKKMEEDKVRASSYEDDDSAGALEWLAAVLGMPVKSDAPPLEKTPLLTWGLAGLMVVFFFVLYISGANVFKEWGFITAQPLRFYGLTVITSFFLHADIVHLAGNLYFLIVFGDNVEDRLGKIKFLALIFFSHVAGLVLYSYLSPGSFIPSIGASGGIAGVIAYYAILFPDARISMWIRSGWSYGARRVTIPAAFALALFIALQIFGAFLQKNGVGGINYFAHLGGLGVGVAAAVAYRIRSSQKDTETA